MHLITSPIQHRAGFRNEEGNEARQSWKSWDNHDRLTDLDYADDITLLAESDRLEEGTSSLNQEATKIGLRISAEKSKVMKIGIEHTPININAGTTQLENVTKFTYLGSTLSYEGDADIDIRTRIAKAALVFRRLQPLWAITSNSNNIKLRLHLSIVVPTAIYAWKMSASAIKKINGFHLSCLRRIMKIRSLPLRLQPTLLLVSP
ncbi:hypothetical protein Y032_0022g534 [Ancylostoma ceylanicum]|uniref:Uncharacterized protein n=1 Tax=Ancylostoma ceylanicum TaxID=53326 RepID=A0A016UXW4_9BILA|nr:hypothetical protein Y032_0022g534 [Ancylostoma ceylanicum]